MTDETETAGSSPIGASQLRWIYVAGIALNVVALAVAARSGEPLIALTLGVVIVYLGIRYRMLGSS